MIILHYKGKLMASNIIKQTNLGYFIIEFPFLLLNNTFQYINFFFNYQILKIFLNIHIQKIVTFSGEPKSTQQNCW